MAKAYEFLLNHVTNTKLRGNTDLLNVLRPYMLLGDDKCNYNFVLVSDGHLSRPNELFQCLHSNFNTNEESNAFKRIFACSIGNVANNNHMLKMIGRVTNGSYETFDSKYQSKWKSKCLDLIDKMKQPAAVKDIKIEWQNMNGNVQAPASIGSLFNGRRVTAYAFIPNCQQAHLKANINGQEVSTVVTCPELLIARDDDLLHKLTAKALIDDWQYGILCGDDKIQNDLSKLKLKEKIISLSVKYSISSEYTSFLAIEDRDDEEKRGRKLNQDSTLSMSDLLMRESIDILPYMGYEDEESQKRKKHNEEIELTLENQLKMSEKERDVFFEFLLKNKSRLSKSGGVLSLRYALLLSNEYKRKRDFVKAGMECKEAFDSSIAELDCLSEDSYKEVINFYSKLPRILLTLPVLSPNKMFWALKEIYFEVRQNCN